MECAGNRSVVKHLCDEVCITVCVHTISSTRSTGSILCFPFVIQNTNWNIIHFSLLENLLDFNPSNFPLIGQFLLGRDRLMLGLW